MRQIHTTGGNKQSWPSIIWCEHEPERGSPDAIVMQRAERVCSCGVRMLCVCTRILAFARECTVALQYLYYQCVMLIQGHTYIYLSIGECAYVYVRVCVQLSWCKCCPISSRSLSFCSLSIRWRVSPRGAIVWAAVEDKQGRRRTHRLPWQHSRALQSLTPQPFNIHTYHPSVNICMRLLTHIGWEINKGSHDRLSWQVCQKNVDTSYTYAHKTQYTEDYRGGRLLLVNGPKPQIQRGGKCAHKWHPVG